MQKNLLIDKLTPPLDHKYFLDYEQGYKQVY